jgi:hypothetical protein
MTKAAVISISADSAVFLFFTVGAPEFWVYRRSDGVETGVGSVG